MRVWKRICSYLACFFLLPLFSSALPLGAQDAVPYSTGDWDADSLGNHRAVIHVAEAADAVFIHVPWRRRDPQPERKNILVFEAGSGVQVRNVFPAEINREFGDLVFQAEKAPHNYYIYYLINRMEGRSNYPTVTYQEPENTAQAAWLERHHLEKPGGNLTKRFPQAKVIEFQSIDAFNSFYPMEVIATQAEIQRLSDAFPEADFLLFPEDRRFPIRMTRDLPSRWIKRGPETLFQGEAARGEYFAFQIGLFAIRAPLKHVEVRFSALQREGSASSLPEDAFTCFNTEGVDWTARKFKKSLSVPRNRIQPLWCGIQIPKNAEPGSYTTTVAVTAQDQSERQVQIRLRILDRSLADAGDSEPWRHSRLRWLNSVLAFDNGIVPPYTPLKKSGRRIDCLGRSVLLDDMGFPRNIRSYFPPEMTSIGEAFQEVLSGPIHFVLESAAGRRLVWTDPQLEFQEESEGTVTWMSSASAGSLKILCSARMEFEGFLDFEVKVTALRSMDLNDIRLEIPLDSKSATFMMGLGAKGGYRPKNVHWKWDQKHNQDSVWIGAANAGLQCSVRDENYSRPLNTNFYLLKPLVLPTSWWNQGRGGCDIEEKEQGVVAIRFYSGARRMEAGETLYYNFSLLLTPFRALDTQKQWRTRYYHRYAPLDEIKATGANTVNVHHATGINPYINYPFLRPDEMKAYIDEAHARHMQVKIYYTVRELSNRAPELFALRSLGEEIFFPGEGGGFSWLQEHLDSDYIAAWFVPQLKDAAIINSGVSRWHNYYVEGLNWLANNVGIDGLYIDDVAFDRTTMKRVRKVLDRNRQGAQIDLHSANQFNVRDGFANSANLYLEHFPFIDRLWFGEYFDYDSPPEFWLVEVSGIPFGLMGEMLQGGGNAWRGMLYGMTSRLPWAGDPRPLWKLWDEFGISEASMIGYWVPSCPVKSNRSDVLVTAYVKKEKILLALASWADSVVQVRLEIDWEGLGLEQSATRLRAPAILDFQPNTVFSPSDAIPIRPGKGWLLLLEPMK